MSIQLNLENIKVKPTLHFISLFWLRSFFSFYFTILCIFLWNLPTKEKFMNSKMQQNMVSCVLTFDIGNRSVSPIGIQTSSTKKCNVSFGHLNVNFWKKLIILLLTLLAYGTQFNCPTDTLHLTFSKNQK
jgi:hypothetical protein